MFLRLAFFAGVMLGMTMASAKCNAAETADVDTLASQELNEVVVTANSSFQRLGDVQLGVERLEMNTLAKTPVLFGEVDIIKSITLLPGVRQESEGSGGYMVRGGTASQNLVQLDGATFYNHKGLSVREARAHIEPGLN